MSEISDYEFTNHRTTFHRSNTSFFYDKLKFKKANHKSQSGPVLTF